MEKENQERIKLKLAMSLHSFLNKNKRIYESNKQNKEIVKSYNDIAINADLRKATVSNAFNGNNLPEITSLFPIIESMGYSISEFFEFYDSIQEKDLKDFKTKL